MTHTACGGCRRFIFGRPAIKGNNAHRQIWANLMITVLTALNCFSRWFCRPGDPAHSNRRPSGRFVFLVFLSSFGWSDCRRLYSGPTDAPASHTRCYRYDPAPKVTTGVSSSTKGETTMQNQTHPHPRVISSTGQPKTYRVKIRGMGAVRRHFIEAGSAEEAIGPVDRKVDGKTGSNETCVVRRTMAFESSPTRRWKADSSPDRREGGRRGPPLSRLLSAPLLLQDRFLTATFSLRPAHKATENGRGIFMVWISKKTDSACTLWALPWASPNRVCAVAGRQKASAQTGWRRWNKAV